MSDDRTTIDRICVRFYVSGRVQGVFYRATTRDRAMRLGIVGYAENLPDRRVEVLACGTPDAVAQLQAWLPKGPPGAQVSKVTRETVALQPPADFTIR